MKIPLISVLRRRTIPACALALFVCGAGARAAEPVATVQAAYREVELTYAVDATIEAVRQSTVASQISGRIVEIRYDVGDRVEKGQVIVRIDEREASQVLAGSQAQAAQAAAVLENARAQLERSRQLAAQRFISQAALDKAQADYNAAAAAYQAATAGAGQAATTKGFTTIVAPYSGVVSARHVQLGEMATPGKPLMSGFDPNEMRAVASVPEYKLAQVRAASSALIEIPALERWIPAESFTVLPIAEARTHAAQVRLALPPGKDLFPGQFARAHFVIGKATRLVVPTKAILRRSEVTAVYVIGQHDEVSLRQVRIGDAVGRNETEILAGISSGERVAIDPVKAGMLSRPAEGQTAPPRP